MSTASQFRKDIFKVAVFSLLALFLVPVVSSLFVRHVQTQMDSSFTAALVGKIRAQIAPGAEQQEKIAFVTRYPASSVCADDSPEMQAYRSVVCAPYSEVWQFYWVQQVSAWTLGISSFALFASLALGALAFVNRRAQYWSFVLGWRMLTLVSALETILQGSLAVWLSFWIPAFFIERYYIKLIVIIGVLAVVYAFYAIACIFKHPPQDYRVDGELVDADASPELWARIRELAAQIGTSAPDQLIAGIDANFFVTETPLTIADQSTLSGRSLYVSIPLLRILEQAEADAVLAHELAHLSGGDAASSAALGPKLSQYDMYCQMMLEKKIAFVYYLMAMYRLIFEFALRRDSREREFLADRVAAQQVSATGIVRSLLKVAAYAGYRARIERQLFEQNQLQQQLGIANYISAGLGPYATSAQFIEDMQSANVPHPFDSHPPLHERMDNVAYVVADQDVGALVAEPAQLSWAAFIKGVDDIEQRLWSAYEQQFSASHEHSLAYRYEPANEAELAVVLKYFPDRVFPLKGKQITITHSGMVLPEQSETLSWDSVCNLRYEDGIGGDVLHITHPEKGWLGAKTTKVKLPGIKNNREQFKQDLVCYWQRHQIMRQQMHANE